MKRSPYSQPVIIAVSLAVLGGRAISAQDKYTCASAGWARVLRVQGIRRLAGVAISQSGDLIEVILGNPEMIEAYRAGVPGTASLSPTAPRWRRSIGTRKRTEAPVSRRCRTPCMTSTSW